MRLKKMIGLMMCCALIVSGLGTVGNTQAATGLTGGNSIQKEAVPTEPAQGPDGGEQTEAPDQTQKPDGGEQTEAPDQTQKPGGGEQTEAPDQTQKPDGGEQTEAPDQTQKPDGGEQTETPVQTLTPLQTLVPLPTATGGAVTPASSPAVTTTASAVGTVLTVGNFSYAVEKACAGTEAGTVKVKKVTDAAKAKKSLSVPEKITTAGGESFKVTGIGKQAFVGCTALKKVIIKKNVTYIGIRAFQQVSTLQTVMIGSGVTTIKDRAFAGCKGIRNITLPYQVKFIGPRAFYNCKLLQAVMIDSKNITTVKAKAFGHNKKGRYVIVPSGKKALYQSLIKASGATGIKVYTY